MNILQSTDDFQIRIHSGLRAVGYALTAGLAGVMIVGWLLVSPFFRLVIYLGDSYLGRLTIK